MKRKKILLVDDDAAIRLGIRDYFDHHGLDVVEAADCRRGAELFAAALCDAAIIDHRLPDGSALELLPRLRAIDADVPLLVLTAYGSIELAVQAVKLGAEQFLTKPVELAALLTVIERLLQDSRRRRQHTADAVRERRRRVDPFLGSSPAIRTLERQARKLLGAESTILLHGETGTGKSVLAAWLHRNGARADEAFVDLNCAGLSREFLETELFGHERGTFTGAVSAKRGLLEVAHRGTVFLDEIGDMDLQVQAKLIKVLEEKRFRRLGETADRFVEVRLIAATNHDLPALVADSRFRGDLYFRVGALPLTVPALRERSEDIPALCDALLPQLATDMGKGQIGLDAGALNALQAHAWPGNLRELRNVLERAVLLCERRVIGRADLRFETRPASFAASDDDLRLTLAELERKHIERVLRDEHGKVDVAARRLGVSRSSLYQKLKQFGLSKV